MHFREYPLLNVPNMVAVMLRAAATGASVEECAARLDRLLEQAHERPPVAAEEVRRRIEVLRRYLAEARLVTPEPDRFRLTPRGEEALRRHPAGMDAADLMIYPEFAAFIHRMGRDRGSMDPREAAYDEGFEAYRAGRLLADNPHGPDTVDHLAWENGWFEALDEDAGAPPPTP